jgi:hypothetical protein
VSATRVRLGWELQEIEDALDAARMLCDAIAFGMHVSEDDRQAAPRAAAAVMSLVGQRLRLLRQVAQGAAGVDVLLAPFNAVAVADTEEESDSTDVYLPISESEREGS